MAKKNNIIYCLEMKEGRKWTQVFFCTTLRELNKEANKAADLESHYNRKVYFRTVRYFREEGM